MGKQHNNDDDVNDEKKMDGHFLLIGLDTYM